MPIKTVFRDGPVTVTLDDRTTDLARRAVENVLPGVLERLEREVAQVADHARQDWPVRTGVSRNGLYVVTTIDVGRGRVGAGIRNDVAYAGYIRPRELHGAATAWQRYVRVPMAALRAELVRELGPEISRLLRAAQAA